MNREERKLNEIKKDLKLITSNKLSMSQSKLLFMGITYEIILRKDLFPKNEDLRGFINNVFVENFKEKIPFKDYLYKSRTLLAARVQRKIYSDLEYNKIADMVHELYKIFPDEEIKKIGIKKGNEGNDEELSEWMNFIKNEGTHK